MCIGKHHVVLAIDRAGIVGPDGETHQGVFDTAFLRTIPGLTLMAPKNHRELDDMLEYAINEFDGPIAIRYPKGNVYTGMSDYQSKIEYGKAEILYEEREIMLVAFGSMNAVAEEVRNKLKVDGYGVTLVNLRFAAPIDMDVIDKLAHKHKTLVVLEENIYTGGIGQAIMAHMHEVKTNIQCISVALPDEFIKHGKREFLLKKYGLDAQSVYDRIKNVVDK
jgi:1-deoxy-D-xylulose-5-phosphate synthase